MFERTRRLVVALSVLSFFYPAEAAVVTLLDGSAYSGLEIVEFDGEKNLFRIIRIENQISIRASEVSTIEFQNQPGVVALREGSTYSDLEILQFDVPQNRLTVQKSGKVLNLPLSEIARVEIVSVEPRDAPPGISPAVGVNEDPNPPLVTGADSSDTWQEEGLYSNLPEGFGEKRITAAGDQKNGDGYTPRWTTDSGAKASEKKKIEPAEKREPRKSLSTKRGSSRERPSRDKRRQARTSERRSSGSSRESGRPRRSLFDSGSNNPVNETNFR